MRSHPDWLQDLDQAADAVPTYLSHRLRPEANSGHARNLRPAPDGHLRCHCDLALVAFDDPRTFVHTGRLPRAGRHAAVPMRLIRGALSDVVTADTAGELRAALPNSGSITVSRASHMVAGDGKETFTSAVVEFLDRVFRTGEAA